MKTDKHDLRSTDSLAAQNDQQTPNPKIKNKIPKVDFKTSHIINIIKGQMLGERYQIQNCIGMGEFGVVYIVNDMRNYKSKHSSKPLVAKI